MGIRWWVVWMVACAVSSCCKSKTEPGESRAGDSGRGPSSPDRGDITITMGEDGGYKVSGAGPMKGNPADCAAFKACCQAREASLACGLIQSTEQDCGKALTSIRNILTEQGAQLPPGCK